MASSHPPLACCGCLLDMDFLGTHGFFGGLGVSLCVHGLQMTKFGLSQSHSQIFILQRRHMGSLQAIHRPVAFLWRSLVLESCMALYTVLNRSEFGGNGLPVGRG